MTSLRAPRGGKIYTGTIDGNPSYSDGKCAVVGALPPSWSRKLGESVLTEIGSAMNAARPANTKRVFVGGVGSVVSFCDGSRLKRSHFNALGGCESEWFSGKGYMFRDVLEARSPLGDVLGYAIGVGR